MIVPHIHTGLDSVFCRQYVDGSSPHLQSSVSFSVVVGHGEYPTRSLTAHWCFSISRCCGDGKEVESWLMASLVAISVPVGECSYF